MCKLLDDCNDLRALKLSAVGDLQEGVRLINTTTARFLEDLLCFCDNCKLFGSCCHCSLMVSCNLHAIRTGGGKLILCCSKFFFSDRKIPFCCCFTFLCSGQRRFLLLEIGGVCTNLIFKGLLQ